MRRTNSPPIRSAILLCFMFMSTTLFGQSLWGVTSGGGTNGAGVIFQTATDGTGQTVRHNFQTTFPGAVPTGKLELAANGKYYGTTAEGGLHGWGVLYEFDPATNAYTKKLDFQSEATRYGALTLASNNKFYATSRYGGTIAEYDPATNVLTVKFTFTWATNGGPWGDLVRGSNGKLYGISTTQPYVLNIYEFDPVTSTFTQRVSNMGSTPGAPHMPVLVPAPNGLLYATLRTTGGPSGLVSYNPATNVYSVVAPFPAWNGYVNFGLTAANGKLYGFTTPSGTYQTRILEFDYTTNTFNLRYTFASSSETPVDWVYAANGKFYGLVSQPSDGMAIFEWNPVTAAYVVKATYDHTPFLTASSYSAGLILSSAGKVYGTVSRNGVTLKGYLFEYDIAANTYNNRVDFSYSPNGAYPTSGIVQANNRKLYGMTRDGGAVDQGVVYQFDPATNTYTKLLDFDYNTNGAKPLGSLTLADNGKLYGWTSDGGAYSDGVAFTIDPATNTFTKLVDLYYAGGIGGSPEGSLVPGPNGKLIGFGTSPNYGAIIQVDPSTDVVSLMRQLTATSGASPLGDPLLASDGKIYGTAAGSLGAGVPGSFVYDPATTTWTKLPNGCPTRGSYVQDANGKLYTFGYNIIEVDPATNTCTTKAAIPLSSGWSEDAKLTRSSNGKYYGLTYAGNAGNTLFEYNVATNVVTTKVTFTGANGFNPSGDLHLTMTPQTAASNITFSPTYTTQLQINFTAGSGTKRLVVIKQGSAVDFVPTENATYNVGDIISGNRIVKIDGGSNVYVTGLTASTNYHVKIFEYTETGTKKNYLVANAPVANVTTLPPPNCPFTSPANGATFIYVTPTCIANAITGASTYTLEVSPVSDFSSGVIVRTGVRNQVFTGLAYSTLYYARAKTNLSPDYSVVTTFTTGPPEAFSYVSSPINGATGQNCNLAVSSSFVHYANTYTIELNTASDFTGTSIVKSGASAGQGFNNLALSTTYYSRVKTDLSPNWGPTRSFVVGDAQTLSFLATPAHGSTNQWWNLTLVANTVTGATNYSVRLSPVSDFSSGLITASAASTNIPVAGLAYNTLYYVQIHTNLNPGLWGPSRVFTTAHPLYFSFVTSPGSGAVNVARTVNLASNVVRDATSYTIEANTASDFSGTSIVNTSSSNSIPFSLAYGTTYYTRVKTNLDPGWGSTRSFTTSTAQYNSYVVTPANAVGNQLPTLNVVANEIFGATSYTIQLSPLSDFSSGVIEQTGPTRTLNFSQLVPITTYYSRVHTSVAPGLWGPTRSFTTANQYLTSPANGAVNVLWSTVLITNTTSTATSYTIEANTLPDFTGTSIVKTGASSNQNFVLAYDQTYYVRCRSNIAGGWGSDRSFTTGNPVSLSYTIAPVNGATNVALAPQVWANVLPGATSYTVELNPASDFSGTPIIKTQASSTMGFTGLAPGTTYYTRAKTSLDPTQWGPTRSFTTVNARIMADDIPTTPDVELETNNFEVVLDNNPFRTHLGLTVKGKSSIAEIQMIDILGRVAIHSSIPTNQHVEIATSFSPGVYLVRVVHDGEIITRRVVKE